MKRVTVFVTSFLLWILLVWPFAQTGGPGPGARTQDIVAGLAVALLVALVMRDIEPRRFPLWLRPSRYFWLLVYLVVLAGYIVRANLDVAYRILHPAMPIRPGIVKVRTSLKSAGAITMLANSITLTPGTMSVQVNENGDLYVHCINVRATGVEEATRWIVRPFEWFLKRIFE